ncbi:MAG: sensor domain-containing diguanylate cyclase [Candidatus Edwardsbacteria bacterium]|nr:sensor domain-containing diguanylate cyclase [Candidatus Edwardsbacteria bacterium]
MPNRAKRAIHIISFEEKLSGWVRWAVLFLALLLVTLRPQDLAGHYLGLYLTLGLAALYNLLVFFAGRKMLKFLRAFWVSLVFDLVFASLLIAFTMGAQSQFFYLYYLTIFLAAVSGNRQAALKVTVLASGMYFLALIWRGELSWDQYFLYDLLFKIGLLSLTAFWAGLLSDQQKRWRLRNQELCQIADEWTKTASDIQSAALFGMGALLSSSRNIEETLNLTLDAVQDLLQADRCSILLLDHDTNELVLRASRGVRAGAVGKLRLKSDQGIAGEVLRTGQPLNVPDTDKEPLFVPSPKHYHNRIRSMLVVPLIIRDRRIGVINISEVKSNRKFSESELAAMVLVANYTAVALENAGILEEKEKEATTDGLTGLHNYRYFIEEFGRRLEHWQKKQAMVSLIWLDLDFFKEYNDNFGHLKGSEILKRLGDIMKTAVGVKEAVYFRYGGDEFAVILPGVENQTAVEKAESVRHSIYHTEFAERKPGGKQLSASIGVVSCPADGQEYRALIEKADQAMYHAKERGKNQVAFWQDDKIIIYRRKE